MPVWPSTPVCSGERCRDDRPDLGIGGAWIDLGSQQVHLVEAPVPSNLGQHFAIRVGDLDSVVGEFARGSRWATRSLSGPTVRRSSTTRPGTPSSCTRWAGPADPVFSAGQG